MLTTIKRSQRLVERRRRGNRPVEREVRREDRRRDEAHSHSHVFQHIIRIAAHDAADGHIQIAGAPAQIRDAIRHRLRRSAPRRRVEGTDERARVAAR